MKGLLTCPRCGDKQEEDIPEGSCLPFYRCQGCGQLIQARSCCVFCDFADRPCPVGHQSL